MSVPILYAGSRYHPVPFVPIPIPPPPVAPHFSSAEIGTVNAFTLPVTFDQDISASDYSAGVTIKVNGTATSITSATRQANHAIVRYVIPILWHGSADTVTWEYAQASGNIVAETGGTALGDVTAQSVTNNCEYAALLDLQADALALNDGDPVSTWADASGAGRDFTQTGTARPAKQTDAGYPTVVFDGTDDVLIGPDFANALPAFTIMGIANSDVNNSGTAIWISKISRISTEGWFSELSAGAQIIECFVSYQTNLTGYLFTVTRDILELGGWRFWTLEKTSDSTGTIYAAGDSTGSVIDNGAGTTFSNTEPVRLGSVGDPITAGDGFWMGSLRGVLIFAPIPAATNRAALEVRLAARYGITL